MQSILLFDIMKRQICEKNTVTDYTEENEATAYNINYIQKIH